MENMYNSGEYMWSLFVGHLAIEKLLKAIFILKTGSDVPRIHDLTKLAIKCGLNIETDSRKEVLEMITLFNIEARY